MRGPGVPSAVGVRLRGAVGAPPGRVVLLVPALGLAFGFVAAVSGVAHATWLGLPSGVAAANYHTVGRRSAITGEFDHLTMADFRAVQQAIPQIEWAFADRWPIGRDLQHAGGEIPIVVREVSPRFFDVLGVKMAGAPGEGVVVGHDFWQGHFAGAADVVGRAFSLKYERSTTVVGVAPADFADVFGGEADAWVLSEGAGYGVPGSGSRFRPWGKLAFGAAAPGLDHEALTAALAGISPVLELTMYNATTVLHNVSPDDWLEAHRGLTAVPDRRSDAAVHLRWLAAVIAGLLLLAVLSLIDFAATRTAKSDGHATARIAAGATPTHLFRESVVRNGVWLLLVAAISALSFFWLAGVLLRVEPFRSYLERLPAGSQIVGVGAGAVLIGVSFCGAIGWVARRDFRASRSFSAVVGSGPPRRRTERLLLSLAVLGLVLATSLLVRYVADSGRGAWLRRGGCLGLPAPEGTRVDAVRLGGRCTGRPDRRHAGSPGRLPCGHGAVAAPACAANGAGGSAGGGFRSAVGGGDRPAPDGLPQRGRSGLLRHGSRTLRRRQAVLFGERGGRERGAGGHPWP